MTQATNTPAFNLQACFAIDYDFATHRCYFFGSNVAIGANGAAVLLHCILAINTPQPSSIGTRPNPTVVHITLCESMHAPRVTELSTVSFPFHSKSILVKTRKCVAKPSV